MKHAATPSFLVDDVPPMGIYETLYGFRDAFGQFMGTEGTHPWSQGFPLTTRLERFDGPELPSSVDVTPDDRLYPKAWGHPPVPIPGPGPARPPSPWASGRPPWP